MSSWWVLVIGLGVVTVVSKAAGVLMLNDRELPPWVARRLALLAPALFAAFVASQTLLEGGRPVVDARVVGVAAGGFALARRAPLWAGVAVAGGTTALLRVLGWS